MLNEKLSRYGQWTYRGAWAIEIVAATLGLVTGIALGYQGYTAGETGDAFGFVLASAPFFMVALAELTKIPIATLLFAAPNLYKPFLLLFLIGLAFITFETVFTGLERAAALRQLQYEELFTGLRQRQQELARLESESDGLAEASATLEAQRQYEALFKQRQDEVNSIRDEIGRLDEESVPPALRAEINRTRQRLEEKQAALQSLYDRQEREINRERAAFESQRASYQQRIKDAEERGDQEYARSQKAELARLKNPVPAIQKQYEGPIADVQTDVDRLNEQIDTLNARVPSSDDPAIRQRRATLERQLQSVEERWQGRLDAATDALRQAQDRDGAREITLANRQQRIDQINEEINQLERERVPLARTDQVRRIAARFFGRNPENVSAEEADLVAIIWFGSLAALAALTGPLTAMVALGLQSIADRTGLKREGRLSRTLRNLLLNWRFKRTKTRTIQVPVEKPIREIVYVPVLTDDPEAIRASIEKSVPKEVADLVSIRLADMEYGESAFNTNRQATGRNSNNGRQSRSRRSKT